MPHRCNREHSPKQNGQRVPVVYFVGFASFRRHDVLSSKVLTREASQARSSGIERNRTIRVHDRPFVMARCWWRWRSLCCWSAQRPALRFIISVAAPQRILASLAGNILGPGELVGVLSLDLAHTSMGGRVLLLERDCNSPHSQSWPWLWRFESFWTGGSNTTLSQPERSFMPRWNRVIAAKCTVTQLPFTKRPTPAPTSDHSNVHGLLPSSRVSLHLSRFLVLSPSPQIPMGSLIADRQYSILLSSLPLQLRRPYALHRLLYVVALCRTTMRIRTTSNVSIDYGMDASAYTICSCSSQ